MPLGLTRIGRVDSPVPQNHQFIGIGIGKQHCLVENKDNMLFIEPLEGSTYINGELLKEKMEIHHNFRIILGTHHVFRVHNPFEEDESSNDIQNPDWHFAVKEFANNQNSSLVESLATSQDSFSHDENIIEDMLLKLNEDKKESKKILKEKQNKFEEKLKDIENMQVDENEKNKLKEEAESEFELQKKKLQNREEKLKQVFELKKERIQISQERKFKENLNLKQKEEELISTIMLVNEANNLAKALEKPTRFKITVRPILQESENQSEETQDTEILIEAIDEKEGSTAFFSLQEFMERLEKMRELYEEFEKKLSSVLTEEDQSNEQKIENNSNNEDPFSISTQNVLLGISHLYLKHLYYLTNLLWNVQIVSHSGQILGQLNVEIEPVKKFEESFQNEKEWENFLLGKTLGFKIKINQISNFSITDYVFVFTTFSFWDKYNFKTESIDEPKEINSRHIVPINYSTEISLEVTPEFLEYLKNGFMNLEVWVHTFKQVNFIIFIIFYFLLFIFINLIIFY